MSDGVDHQTTGRTSPHPTRAGLSSTPLYSASLDQAHIADALAHSPDNGATLDLTHRNLTDIGESGLEGLATIGREDLVEDESSVLRIALGYNRLATLPMAFALLSRLRYLNLKNNSFSVFPDVLTVMPSLEILDMSRNKIKRLPSHPGSLSKLKVFHIARNKLTRLPSYLIEFRNLNILKADHNPIEWPPKTVMEPSGGLDDPQDMKTWIRSIQKWMLENGPNTGGRKASDESISIEQDLDSAIEESFNSWSRFPIDDSDFDAGVTPHARSFSVDSEFSAYSEMDAPRPPSRQPPSSDSPRSDRPPPLHLGVLPPYTSSRPQSRSPDSYLPTPAESVSSTDEESATDSAAQQREHMRNASYAGGARSPKRTIPGKKSLPDLRTAKMNFGVQRKPPEMPTRGHLNAQDLPSSSSSKLAEDFSMPSPLSMGQDSGYSEGRSYASHIVKPFAQEAAAASPTSLDRPAPSMDVERNYYFRRLSALPSSSVANTLPRSLLSLIDAARSMLYAVCQVYQTLQHYTVYAIDDRLSSILRKVLDPASAYMLQLISTLDRYDIMSRKALPSPAVCRSVIESCRDMVAVFGKAVGVLALQLKVIQTLDDVRYLRSMLLVLYGATGDIAHAWQTMVPHIDAVKPLLREHRRPPIVKAHSNTSPTRTALVANVGTPEPVPASAPPTSSPFLGSGGTPSMLRSRSTQPASSVTVTRSHTARRHAGSFSSKDVEIGKKLPSFEDIPHFAAGVANGQTPTLRITRRQTTAASSVSPAPSPPIPVAGVSSQQLPSPSPSMGTIARSAPARNHSRQGSQSSLLTSSASSSPSISAKSTPVLEVPPNSRTLVDKEALDAMKLAVEAAPAVWEMMDDILADVQDMKIDVHESLDKAKSVTQRLGENIRAVQQGDPTADRMTLREDAHVFVKTVVQLSNIIKTYSGAHAASSTLRSKMVKLTNSTEEFVILLHVSSFSPSSTPRPYSPLLNGSSPHVDLGVPEDNRLGSNLSRSRSAQPSGSSKLTTTLAKDLPRSALPSQSFQINEPWRPGTGLEVQGSG